MRRRIQPWPWSVQARQWNAQGKGSRPRIIDATGKPVRLSNMKQATIAAMAPLLLERLEALIDQAEMLHMQVNSALACNTKKHHSLTQARELVDIAGRVLANGGG